jgi:hypothetical protein
MLGMMLATCFALVTNATQLTAAPGVFVFKLLLINTAFALFALAITRVRRSLGFDPLLIALLWFPTEYVLILCTDLHDVFALAETGSGLVIGFCSLFGVLLGSLVVVLVNALILALVRKVEVKLCSTNRLVIEWNRQTHIQLEEPACETRCYCLPSVCAPPLPSSVLVSA